MLGPRPQCICHQSRFGASRASGHITRLRVSSRQHAVSNSSAVVDQILNMIKDTDGGMSLSDDKKGEVDLLLDQLEEAGSGSAPLIDPRLMGNYEVAYTSTRNASSQSGNPAGGRFRGTLGRAIFSTTGLYQSVLTVPDNPTPVVTNKVSFKALGILDGAVGLRGVIEPVGDDNATVKVLFDPPVLTLKDSLHLRIGPPSSVQLTTTYLDDRVRIGKGSRGSLFVFTRGGLADEAQMDIVGKQGTSKSALVAFSVFFVTLMLGGLGMWMSGHPVLRVGAVLGWLLGVGIATVVKEGGIIRGDNVTPAGKETPAGDVTPTVGATPV